ncbi:MAG: glycosyltransferase family 2 protein [Candidatus Portnoybacteria bacterium]|nr:glycosyltransferase family 2 protein [Candidatus Portnoybacteria bacterium]
MNDIAIQIVNYNTKKYLINCINDIINGLKGCVISYKIHVLDNDSRDDLSDLANEHADILELYKSEKNLGFGAGHNFLAKRNESKHILILNPDLKFIEPLTIKRLYNFIEKESDNRVAVVGPKLLDDKGSQHWDHGELNGIWGWFSEKFGGSHWRNINTISEVAWVSGAFLLVSRDVFNKVGGFDEGFFLYKEEEDLCLRIKQEGFRIFYNPQIKVFHFGSVVAAKSEFFDASDKYFFEKHFKNRGFIILLLNRLKHIFFNKFLY